MISYMLVGLRFFMDKKTKKYYQSCMMCCRCDPTLRPLTSTAPVTPCPGDGKLAACSGRCVLCEVCVSTGLSTGGGLTYLTDFTSGGERPDYLSEVIKLFST